jgi:hypothetical protein
MSYRPSNLIYWGAAVVYFASIAAAYFFAHRDTSCPQIDATKLTADELKTFMADADKAGVCIDVKK